MKTFIKASLLLTIVVLWAGSAVPLSAATTIFDNSTTDLLTRFNPGSFQVGDQIKLDPATPWARYMTDFSFEYYGYGFNTTFPAQFTGNVQADVQFYLNNGNTFNGYAMPGTSFWDSGWFTVPGVTSRNTFEFTPGADNIPVGGLFIPASEFTWTVQFRGMDGGDVVGLDIYSPPSVGQDYPDYWQNNGGWQLMTNGVVSSMDFAARIQAVPEPSTLTFSILGGMTILTLARRLRRKE
jgi:hypothetical protein